MIYMVLKSYFTLLISVTCGALFTFLVGAYFIIKSVWRKSKAIDNGKLVVMPERPSFTITSKDLNAIAGDDIIATQLDLARAYVESGRKQLAKKILTVVQSKGTPAQKAEAESLQKLG